MFKSFSVAINSMVDIRIQHKIYPKQFMYVMILTASTMIHILWNINSNKNTTNQTNFCT